jgi:hypothetical protein
MPISARLDAPDVLHHIIIRGIERRNIFRDNGESAEKNKEVLNIDGLVKSRKTDFLLQHIGIMQCDDTICCGQNKMLGLFTRPSNIK